LYSIPPPGFAGRAGQGRAERAERARETERESPVASLNATPSQNTAFTLKYGKRTLLNGKT